MAKHRAGVIGHTGRGDYGHGLDTVYVEMSEVDLAAVADADPTGRQNAGERLGVPSANRYADYREMLKREALDLVSVGARWVGEHEEMVVAAAEAGVRGIFCEKPLARTPREADSMVDACDANGVKLAIAFQTRVHPFIQEAQRLVADGSIGELRGLAGFGKQDTRGGGQDLIVLGTHILDLMCLFCGQPSWVDATVLADGKLAAQRHAREGDEEAGPILGDHLHATYVFQDDVIGTFESRRAADRSGGRFMGLHLLGTEGILAWRGGSLWRYPDSVWSPSATESWEVVCDASGYPNLGPLNTVIVRDLIAAIHEGRDPVASGRDGRRSLEMILGVYAAHRHGRTALPLENREHPLHDWIPDA